MSILKNLNTRVSLYIYKNNEKGTILRLIKIEFIFFRRNDNNNVYNPCVVIKSQLSSQLITIYNIVV